MWVLESEGNDFHGKKRWLRPGKKFLIGRTKEESPAEVMIEDKTISRKHLTVEVGAVGPRDCSNPDTRSQVILEDLQTKIGTLVNDEQISGTTFILNKDRNEITLARYKHKFIISWIPVTLSFSFTGKEEKAGPYAGLYDLLGPCDIKVLTEYRRGVTTHVVARKRNTSKGLQALIDGAYIVHYETFVDALVAACTTPTATDHAPLESDWGKFPSPLAFLPPRGNEPTDRAAEAYAPNANRHDLFEGYTFVFVEKRQFENLCPPINGGGGKAVLREIRPEQTTVDDFVQYVKGIAGEKGLGSFEDGSEGKGVAVIKFNPVKGEGSEWYSEFNRQVSMLLDHRMAEQNEFLDAILGCDASVLRKSLLPEASGTVAPPSTANAYMSSFNVQQNSGTVLPSIEADSLSQQKPAQRTRSRRVVVKRFKGFENSSDEDNDNESVPNSTNPAVTSTSNFQKPPMEPQSQGLFVSQDPGMDIVHDRSPPVEPSQPTQLSQSPVTKPSKRTTRKRNTPPVNFDSDSEDFDRIAPGLAAVKKREEAQIAARRRRGEPTPPPQVVASKKQPSPKGPPAKKVKREVDLLEVARKNKERAEEMARKEREALEEQFGIEGIEKIRDLVIIEEMDVGRPDAPLRTVRADESNRWDDRWNGRKNFKKFVRRGADKGRDLDRVIVPLEEAKKKTAGVGDEYWLEGGSKKKKDRGRDTQDTQSQLGGAVRRVTDPVTVDAEQDMQDEGDEPPMSDEEDQPPKAALSRSQRSQPSQQLGDKTNTTRNLPTKKRAASSTISRPAPTKKAKQANPAPVVVEDSDSGDEHAFKFRRRN